MATVITTPQVGNSYCPQMRLTATISSQTATTATIRVVVDYITYGYTFSSSTSPEVSEKINGTWYDETGWSLNGKTSQRVRDRSVTVNKTTSARSVEVRLYWAMSGFTWHGSAMSDWNLGGSITVPAITSYQVSYNANGGSGAPSAQTKWHGQTLTLSSMVPVRADYNFEGWATSDTATTAEYQPGGSYTANSAATLYAVWELAYVPPTISDLTAIRSDSSGNPEDSGSYAKVGFSWSVDTSIHSDNVLQSIAIAYSEHGAGSWTSVSVSASGTSGTVSQVIGTFDTTKSYDIRATVTDSYGNTSMYVILSQAFFTMDVLAGGHGVAFGMASSVADTFAVAFDNVHLVGETEEANTTMDAIIAALSAMDCVVEEYHSSSGGYRKWRSGRMEQWVTQTYTGTINTSWGSMYRTSGIAGAAWPETFTTIEHCYQGMEGDGGDMAWIAPQRVATTTNAPDFYLMRGASLTSSKSFRVHHYGVGTWAGGSAMNNADETEY